MSGSAAAEAEMAAAFSHEPVAADATAAYGEHPDQVVDLYAPRGGEGTAPLVVLLHGGAWRSPYDRHHLSPLAAHLAGRGLAVASVEYRRGPGGGEPPGGEPPRAGRWPETLDDVATAVARIPGFVEELAAGGAAGAGRWRRVEARHPVLAGHSAGGHLALWAAALHRQPADSPWRPALPLPVRGVVALAPIADFTSSRRLGVCSGAVVQFLGGERKYAERAPYTDPAVLLPTGIPTTVVQGATDLDVPPQVAHAFAGAAAKAGQEVRLVLLEHTGHFPLIDPAAPAVRTVVAEIERLCG